MKTVKIRKAVETMEAVETLETVETVESVETVETVKTVETENLKARDGSACKKELKVFAKVEGGSVEGQMTAASMSSKLGGQ